MSDSFTKRSPDDFDWPATIFLYVVLISLGVGMCFCLRRANRLIPSRFSFPLVDRGQGRQRGAFELGAEEEGLLSHYSDMEDENDAEVIDNQNALRISSNVREQEEEEEFGTMQNQHTSSKKPANSFDIGHDDDDDDDDGEDELYRNPYNDDDNTLKRDH